MMMKKLMMLACSMALLLSACSHINVSDHSPNESANGSRVLDNEITPGSDHDQAPVDEDHGVESDDKKPTTHESSDNTSSNAPDTQDSGNQIPNTSGNTAGEGDDSKADTSGPDESPEGLLNGRIICIDPGHGNPEITGQYEKIAPNSEETKPGTAYGTKGVFTNIPEYVLNMEVSLKLRTALEAQGCIVVMTRESNDENMGNIQRAQIGNDAGSDLVIRIHADGSTNKDAHGVSVLYPGNRYIVDDEILTTSKAASQYVHDAIVQATGAKPRGLVKRDDLTGFNWTTRPVILIEMGFMTNPEEDQLLNDPAYQDKMVEGIVSGLVNYFAASQE